MVISEENTGGRLLATATKYELLRMDSALQLPKGNSNA
jgi:hypothetical protein